MSTPPSSQTVDKPQPPSTPSVDDSPNNDPITRLDALLITYLNHLDTYQKLREELSKNFSAGFLSLAHANRTSNLGSGRRYGEEGYDERMKAGRRVEIEIDSKGKEGEGVREGSQQKNEDLEGHGQPVPDTEPERISYKIIEYKPPEEDSNDSQEKRPRRQPSDSPQPPDSSNPKPEESPDSTTTPQQPKPEPEAKPNKTSPRNPLHWYGILTPPSLRHAQNCFSTAVSEQMPSLLSITSAMGELETQIRELRRELGLAGTDEIEQGRERTAQAEDEDEDNDDKEEGDMSKALPSTSARKSLARRSKPKELPRSRVLKVE